jgi:hypothetical protein
MIIGTLIVLNNKKKYILYKLAFVNGRLLYGFLQEIELGIK